MGKDLLFVSHDKEDKDGDLRVVRPDIVGGSYGEVMKNADFVGYLYMSGKDRVLDFNPTDRWVGKNPARWTPFRVPEVGKATEFMADLYQKGREALGGISEVSAKAAAAVEDWRTAIQAYTKADEFNRAIPEIKKLSAVLLPQVTKILMDTAAAKSIPFDKAAKTFLAPKTEAAEPVGSLL
jgi:hypothetical protein